ncbi:MAG: 3-deoxy-8-phosphooctulonate synthase [Candidatus Hydrogenedentes bacterium]|nr:3-deoxy-8-phosphooctulonate synthase [Candidatus Hydrogenedentota bacterium]
MDTHKMEILIGESIRVPSEKLLLIAGPCVIENYEHTLFLAKEIKEITKEHNVNFVFKASFDKANRTSLHSYRGPGIYEGIEIIKEVKKEANVLVLSDIHESWQAEVCNEVLDVIQIPAFLCRQTDLLISAGKTMKPINIKKGQFLAPWNMVSAIEKIESTGNKNIMLTERGTCFGYNTLVMDPCSIPIMKTSGYPVIVDATHSVQKPGGEGKSSGGNRELAPYIANAGIAVGADGIFIEVHENPDRALSDGPNSIKLSRLPSLIRKWVKLFNCIRELTNENYR